MSALESTVSALAATTGDITLSGEQAVDGIDLYDGATCLAWQQTDPTENALYSVRTGAWVRISQPRYVMVQQGNTYEAGVFILTDTDTYTQANGGRIIPFVNWIECLQSAPSTVQPLDPISLHAFSNAENNYTSTTAGKKSVIKIRPRSLRSSTYDPRLILTAEVSGQADYPGGVFADRPIACYTRVTAIIADFDITVLDWNGLAGLTLGSTLYEDYAYAEYAPTTTAVAGTVTASSPAYNGLRVGYSNDTTIHGMLIETKCDDQASAGAATTVESTATLSLLRGLLIAPP